MDPTPTSTLLKSKLDEVTSFFHNPYSTQIGAMIDTATTPSPTTTSQTPNYPLLLPICDLLNASPTSATVHSQYVKAVRKKLATKSVPVINLTLDLIEITVKNCAEKSDMFLKSVLNKVFLDELVRVMGTVPSTTQDKILQLIQSFYDNFKNEADVANVYHDLKDKGVEFPGVDFDGGMVPMVMKPHHAQHHPIDDDSDTTPILHPVRFNSTKTIQPTIEQKNKILKDLDIVRLNLEVLNEALSDFGEEVGWVESLYSTTQKMQSRLTTLLAQIDDEDGGEDSFLSELLQVNDEMNNAFLRYTRWVKNHQKKKQESSLIDFNSESCTVESGAIPKSRRFSDEILETHTEAEFNEMEAWLESFPAPPPSQPQPQQQPPLQPQLTPSEFDKFLEERLKK